jgi:hypothetical protein
VDIEDKARAVIEDPDQFAISAGPSTASRRARLA